MVAPIEYTPGTRFGKWEVLEAGDSSRGGRTWKCRCDCGTVRDVVGTRLRYGKSTSCGCSNTEAVRYSLWQGVGDIGKRMVTSYQRGATLRGLEWSITPNYMWDLFQEQRGMCALTGVPLTMYEYTTDYRTYTNTRGGQRGQRKNGTASLDRIDSARGYVVGNVQWVHKTINTMKSNHSTDEFVEWCKLVAIHAQL